jgi:hypothetical protein
MIIHALERPAMFPLSLARHRFYFSSLLLFFSDSSVVNAETLTTTFAATHYTGDPGGSMFEIRALSCVRITSFSLHFYDNSEATIDIWTRSGELNLSTMEKSEDWTQISDNMIIVTPNYGYTFPSPLPENAFNPVGIDAGESVTFLYIARVDGGNFFSVLLKLVQLEMYLHQISTWKFLRD